jgi:hypothetical protein
MAPEEPASLKPTVTPPQRRADDDMISLRYEETLAAKPPIPVTVAPPRAPPSDTHPALRRPTSGLEENDASKRDSGLAPTTSSKVREGSVNTVDEHGLSASVTFNTSASKVRSAPQTPTQAHTQVPTTPKARKSRSVSSGSLHRWRKHGSRKGSNPTTPLGNVRPTSPEDFSPITTPIPTDSLLEEDFLDNLSFSKRGSMMLGGKKAVNEQARANGGRR